MSLAVIEIARCRNDQTPHCQPLKVHTCTVAAAVVQLTTLRRLTSYNSKNYYCSVL